MRVRRRGPDSRHQPILTSALPGRQIGISGVAAASANAVYHATAIRVRDLPITLDKLLA